MRLSIGTFFLLFSLSLSSASWADGLDEILARKVVRIGVCEFAPWTFKNAAGQLEGFEIDVARQIASDMGVTAEFKVYPLSEVFDVVGRGEIDFIAAGLAITPSRALRGEFSLPYFESGTTLVTNSKLDKDVIKQPEDLNKEGIVVAIVADTFSADIASQLFDVAKIKSFPDGIAAERELLNGGVQAYLTSLPDARILTKRNPGILIAPLANPVVKSVAGFAVKRGNQALLNYLNAWVTARSADNFLSSSYGYWFNSYDWIKHLKN